ncbi:MAG: hypothetical protein QG656_1483 [Candidatus Hydrogenedentes bacterium]|nr:hypothetical protein [Candidatus Hydrogenedentota bacterium]
MTRNSLIQGDYYVERNIPLNPPSKGEVRGVASNGEVRGVAIWTAQAMLALFFHEATLRGSRIREAWLRETKAGAWLQQSKGPQHVVLMFNE